MRTGRIGAGTPQLRGRLWEAGFVLLLVMVPAQLHVSLVQAGTHDVDGAVLVDARHAGQEAHFEHSALELRSRCVTCILAQRSDVELVRPAPGDQQSASAAKLPESTLCRFSRLLDRTAPSRAPPLV